MAFFTVAGLGAAIGPAAPGIAPSLISVLPGTIAAGGQAAGTIMVAREEAHAVRRQSRSLAPEITAAFRRIDPKWIFGAMVALGGLWVLTRRK